MLFINISDIPIYNAIKKYADKNPISFHMPGHKSGKGEVNDFFDNVFSFDLTEISGTDNLHYPKEAIKEAQKLAAKAFGADKTYFLVNGSTVGILATIMTICKPKDKLIVARDCHKSVINGLILAEAEPFFIKPSFNEEFKIFCSITPESIKKALRDNPNAVGVLVTRPDYYGNCCDIRQIADIVHSFGKILIVDEAHGAHLAFCDELPASALSVGADVTIQSAHKTLSTFTQGAYFHLNSKKIDVEELERNLRMLMTSSPSYLLLASLDISRSIMQHHGKKMLSELIENIKAFEKEIKKMKNIKILGNTEIEHDITRIVINFEECGITGFEVEKILRENHNIYAEMADAFNVVFICTVSDSKNELDSLLKAVLKISENFGKKSNSENINFDLMMIPEMKMSPYEAVEKNKVWIDLRTSEGKICADMVIPYPPGIPIISPGEIILSSTISYICSIIKLGGTVYGLKDDKQICIVKE